MVEMGAVSDGPVKGPVELPTKMFLVDKPFLRIVQEYAQFGRRMMLTRPSSGTTPLPTVREHAQLGELGRH